MTTFAIFVAGMTLGGTLGVILMALMVAASDADDRGWDDAGWLDRKGRRDER